MTLPVFRQAFAPYVQAAAAVELGINHLCRRSCQKAFQLTPSAARP
jgi:hypothetical protein